METQKQLLTSYRELLHKELELRLSRNSRYSLRAFARDLKMAPSRLSDVLRGRYGLSKQAGYEIAQRLGWSAKETTFFCDLIESEHSRSQKRRVEAKKRLEIKKVTASFQQLSMDAFQVISEWYYYGILELTRTNNFQSSSLWIAKKLDLNELVVETAIERLKRLELLGTNKNGKLVAIKDFVASPTDVPSEAIKKFHAKILEKAISALYLQNVESRDFSNIIMSVNKSSMKEAKEDIKRFRREFDRKYGSEKNKTDVYCLAIQFFNLAKDDL